MSSNIHSIVTFSSCSNVVCIYVCCGGFGLGSNHVLYIHGITTPFQGVAFPSCWPVAESQLLADLVNLSTWVNPSSSFWPYIHLESRLGQSTNPWSQLQTALNSLFFLVLMSISLSLPPSHSVSCSWAPRVLGWKPSPTPGLSPPHAGLLLQLSQPGSAAPTSPSVVSPLEILS